jgi:[protein-PII] uridylyltransferase
MKILPESPAAIWRLKLDKLPELSPENIQPQHLKRFLTAAKESILKAFHKHIEVQHLVRAQARAVDQLLYHIWTEIITTKRPQWSVIAVGGYGRSELHPFSDVDLLILLDKPPTQDDEVLISKFITTVWDAGLELGHSVRTVNDCVEQGKQDISVATNLMEARLIAGSPLLFDSMNYATGPEKIWPGDSFYKAKIKEQKIRHRKFFSSSYSLEPNLKKSPGGLRDIQVVGWVAKRHFQVTHLSSLVAFGFLTQSEFQSLEDCMHFLWRVRFALHQIAGRAEDRLLFDLQGPVAEYLGFGNRTDKVAVETLMKEYYRKVLRIQELNDMLLQFFNESILKQTNEKKAIELNQDFQLRGDLIEVKNLELFKIKPENILKMFVVIAERPEIKGIRSETLRALRNSLELIDDNFRNNPKHKKLFIAILSLHQSFSYSFVLMKRYGVLKRYLPVYSRIVGQMQFDLFHAYTVDEHTLFLMKNIARFSQPEHRQEFPYCSEIVVNLKRPELLYISALFHDIAKGRGGDHSELGAIDAYQFCLDHYLSEEDAKLVSWLVRHHLHMSMIAQRKDIQDPEVISLFADMVQDQKHLDLLYTLTVADIRATNPTLWNGWKDALLRELYTATTKWLIQPDTKILEKGEYHKQTRAEVHQLINKKDLPSTALNTLETRVNSSYYQDYSASQVAWHLKILNETENNRQSISELNNQTIVKLRRHENDGASEIFVYTKDRKGLFSTICQFLFEQQLSIVSATIHTLEDGYCLDTFVVLESDGQPVVSGQKYQELSGLLTTILIETSQNLDHQTKLYKLPKKYKIFDVNTKFTFHKSDTDDILELELSTLDRPGLLATVGQLFNRFDIRLYSAKIATFGERTEDIFLVAVDDKSILNNTKKLHQLEKMLASEFSRMNPII